MQPVSMMWSNACMSITPKRLLKLLRHHLVGIALLGSGLLSGGQKGKLNSRDSGQSMACGPKCDGGSQHVRDALRLGP